MEYTLSSGKAVLRRTPAVLRELVVQLPDEWMTCDEGADTWSPYQVLGHLAHIEESDWMDRTERIMHEGPDCVLEPVDREAGYARFAGWSAARVIDHFSTVRASNLERLDALVTVDDLGRQGVHPTFGSVTLGQLLATWVVHDLNHLHQIVKTMAKQYGDAVGPWRSFLPIIDAA